MAERYLNHRMLVVGPGIRTGMAIRYDNPREIGADRLVNAVAAYAKVGGAVHRGRLRHGDHLRPGVRARRVPRRHHHPRASRSRSRRSPSRAAKLPRIDIGPPRSLIGKTTVDAIRSGIVYGFAGQVDAIVRPPARRAGGGHGDDRHRRAGRAHRPAHGDDRRGRRPADAQRAEAAARAQHVGGRRRGRAYHVAVAVSLREPFEIGGVRIPNRVVLAPLAGIGNWFVRLQAKRYGAGLAVSEMVSSFGVHHRNAKTVDELLRIQPEERRGGPVSMQLFGQDPAVMRSAAAHGRRRPAPTSSTSTWAAPCPRSARPARAPRCIDDPDTAVAVARAARAGQRPAGHGQAALGPAARRHARAGAGPPPRRRGGRGGDRLPPALGGRPPQGRAGLRARRAARRRRSTPR